MEEEVAFVLLQEGVGREVGCGTETLTRLLEACLHSLLSFLTSNFPSNPLLPDSLFSIERLLLRPVASSCAISCCAQVPRAAHLQRRAAGIAHRPCRLKKRGLRTPGCPARGPQDAQREDPRTPSARTPGCPARGPQDAQREDSRTPSARTPGRPARGLHILTLQPSWNRPTSSSPGILRGSLDTRTQSLPIGPSNCKSFHSHGHALHTSSGTDMLDPRLWILASP
ncbi:uncharacterized protein LOC116906271 [Rattus rattus]|uniref:uncharacterized protein LOC116906271 n=1 Tax=Rattus rattus TaxID=10117 RepID=UPI0013F37872|nr:uncharacterized protein LOC116906271 [Rattus rattus]